MDASWRLLTLMTLSVKFLTRKKIFFTLFFLFFFVFEKQVVLLLVSTRKVETIGSLISAEKATFQREKCLASL